MHALDQTADLPPRADGRRWASHRPAGWAYGRGIGGATLQSNVGIHRSPLINPGNPGIGYSHSGGGAHHSILLEISNQPPTTRQLSKTRGSHFMTVQCIIELRLGLKHQEESRYLLETSAYAQGVQPGRDRPPHSRSSLAPAILVCLLTDTLKMTACALPQTLAHSHTRVCFVDTLHAPFQSRASGAISCY